MLTRQAFKESIIRCIGMLQIFFVGCLQKCLSVDAKLVETEKVLSSLKIKQWHSLGL